MPCDNAFNVKVGGDIWKEREAYHKFSNICTVDKGAFREVIYLKL